MSTQLRELISTIQETYRKQPAKAKATFQSASELQDGFRSEVSIRQHRLTVDEPAALGGSDQGPNPVEVILAALGTCQEITWRAYATAMGIELDSISVTVEGDMDLRGFFAVDESVRPGFENIRATVRVESSASEEELDQLRQMAEAHCPVLDILQNPVPVSADLVVNAPKAEVA